MVDDPVDSGVVGCSSELVLFDLSFLSFDELEELDEFMLPLGDDVPGFVVSEGVLAPGVEDVLPGVEVLGDDVLGADEPGDDVPAPGVPGEVV